MKHFSAIRNLRGRVRLAVVTLVVCLTAATAGAAPSPTTPAGPDFAAIDAYIEAQMREQRIPGLALGIVQGDQIVRLKGFGIADPSGRPVRPQTPFVLASVSKPITTLAVMPPFRAAEPLFTGAGVRPLTE